MLAALNQSQAILDRALQKSLAVSTRLYVKMAGWNVEIVSPSQSYAAMCERALLGVSTARPSRIDFTIIAADAELTKFAMPIPITIGDLPMREREFLRIEHGVQYATIASPHIIQLFDERRKLGVQLTCDEGQLPPWEPGSVLKSFAYWIALQNKMFMQHAGTVCNGTKGLLLVGRGGSGKSGTVLAGLSDGLISCGDDHVLIEFGETLNARSIYAIMKQDQAGFERCSLFSAEIANLKRNWQNKIEIRPEIIGLPAIDPQCPINAIVFPRVEPSVKSSFKEVTIKDVSDGLVPSNQVEGPGNLSQSIAYTLRLFRSVPIYRLSLGSDAKHVAQTLRNLLEVC